MLILLKFLQFRQMSRHFPIRRPLAISAVISHTQSNEVVTYHATDITLVVQVTQRLIVKKFMCGVSHGISSIKSLTPCK